MLVVDVGGVDVATGGVLIVDVGVGVGVGVGVTTGGVDVVVGAGVGVGSSSRSLIVNASRPITTAATIAPIKRLRLLIVIGGKVISTISRHWHADLCKYGCATSHACLWGGGRKGDKISGQEALKSVEPLYMYKGKASGKPKKFVKPVQKSTSWGRVAEWYDQVITDDDSYQNAVVLPNLLRVMNVQLGERVFDLACGQGFFAREFARIGASVVASDISSELITLAKKNTDSAIEYHVSPAQNSVFVPDASVDKISIVLALQNMEHVERVMRECARVLKPGGKIFFVLNHPTFRVPGSSDWGWDEQKRTQFRRVERYMTEFKYRVQMHPGSDPDEVTYSFHRPLQLYVKHLSRAGFALTHLEEWVSNRKSNSGPRAAAENKARNEIPLFMCVEATKLKK